MQLQQVYQILAKIRVDADLKLVAPGGGLVQVRTDAATGDLLVRCSQADALRDLFELGRTMGAVRLSLSDLRRLRNPLLQTVVVSMKEKRMFTWRPGKFPRVHSLRLLLASLLR